MSDYSIVDPYVPVIKDSNPSVPAGAYDPQGGGVPPAYDDTAALTDQITNLAEWVEWYSWCNVPTAGWVIAALWSVSGQLAAGGSAARAEYLDFVKDAERIHASGEACPQWLADRGQQILERMRAAH